MYRIVQYVLHMSCTTVLHVACNSQGYEMGWRQRGECLRDHKESRPIIILTTGMGDREQPSCRTFIDCRSGKDCHRLMPSQQG